MKKQNKYGLSLINLKNKEYQHNFLVEDDFFSQFEESIIERATINIDIKMLKSETMIQLYFIFIGNVQLVCDRSLDVFDYPIDFQEKMIFKFGEDDEVISDEIEIINRTRIYLDLNQHIYEFINLAIPMKKLHPRFEEDAEEHDDEDENLKVVYQSNNEQNPKKENKSNQTEEDPRWAALKKLKKS